MSWMNAIPSIFDAAGSNGLAMGDGGGLGMGGGEPSLWEPDIVNQTYYQVPSQQPGVQMPKPPIMGSPGDPSGFANYGMTPPPLADPQQQIRGLMGNAMLKDPQNRGRQIAEGPRGGLMAYLSTLGV